MRCLERHNFKSYLNTLIQVSQIMEWGTTGGHQELDRYTYVIKFLYIHHYLIEFIYIHDYTGPACCTILRSGAIK